MVSSKKSSKFQRLQELLVTTFLGNIPAIAMGAKARNIGYKLTFGRIGKSVYIQEGVDFLDTHLIEIGDRVHLFKGIRIDAAGHPNNSILIGDGVAMERNSEIGALDNTYVQISENTFIGSGVSIAGPGNIKIGKRCLIASHVGIFANNHNFADPDKYIADQGVTRKGIEIGNDCWLGHAVTVLDGVTIGEGCVIGAGSVVTKDIPPYSIAVGVPAKVVKNRTKKELENAPALTNK
ncbi:MAG: DapH/DapD/GlmU-related protein [Mastigocoleus sp.]